LKYKSKNIANRDIQFDFKTIKKKPKGRDFNCVADCQEERKKKKYFLTLIAKLYKNVIKNQQ
jgi:hypothetical protein